MKFDGQLNENNYPDKYEDLSFDSWINLHITEPERFEKFRLKLLNDLVESAPERSKARLQGLIFQMESEARRSKSQMAYNIRLAVMMMDSLGELNDHLNQLVVQKSHNFTQNRTPNRNATILPFNRPTETTEER